MGSILVVSDGEKEEDRWRITDRGIFEFWASEVDTQLGQAFIDWLSARSGERTQAFDTFFRDLPKTFAELLPPPQESDFDPGRPAFTADLSARNPSDYVITSENASSVRLEDIEAKNPLLHHVLLNDLIMSVGLRRIYYHHIEQESKEDSFRYLRLLLPVTTDGKVSKVYAYCRPLAQSLSHFERRIRGLLA